MLKEFSTTIYRKWRDRPITNYFRTNFRRNALLSYLTSPFRRGVTQTHTNTLEAYLIGEVLNKLGFNVDVVDRKYRGRISYDDYDLILGFGEPLVRFFYEYKGKNKTKTIYYGTGAHVCYQNQAALSRIKDVYRAKCVWLPESARIIPQTWSEQTTLVDGVIVLGNQFTQKIYQQFFDGPIQTLPVPSISTRRSDLWLQFLDKKNFGRARRHFLWWGGNGLIHKGLDLLLEIFQNYPHAHLHVCGPLANEPRFKKAFTTELTQPNIHLYGYLNLDSPQARALFEKCGFMIFPTCSEGQSGSVINTMAAGLIPITTPVAGMPLNDLNNCGIQIEKPTIKYVQSAIDQALRLSSEEMRAKAHRSIQFTTAHNTPRIFKRKLQAAVQEILNSNPLS